MLKIFLIYLAIAVALAVRGVDLEYRSNVPLVADDIKCLQELGAEYFILESDAYYNISPYAQNFTVASQLLLDAGINRIDTKIYICTDTIVENVVNRLQSVISGSNFNGTVWLLIQESEYNMCWYGEGMKGFIPFVEFIVEELQFYDFQVGILTDYTSWTSLVEYSDIKKSTLLPKLPLAYVSLNTDYNFDDYNSTSEFGDWKKPTRKEDYYTTGFCNNDMQWTYSEK